MPSKSFAFSLTELLVVIVIILIIVALTAPVVISMAGSRNVASNLDSLASLLNYARTEAEARKTYVWVGLANMPAGDPLNASGNHEIAAMAFFSADGSSLASEGSGTLHPLSKIVRLSGMKLVRGFGGSDLSLAFMELLESTQDRFGSGPGHSPPVPVVEAPVPKDLPSHSGIEFSYSVTFTPQGEAMLTPEPNGISDGYDSIIDFGLKRMRGNLPDPSSPDDAAIWLHGGSGRVSQWRLL